MSIRTILAAASGGSATTGAVELACQLARRFEAHLEGFHVLPDAAAVLATTGDLIGGPASVGLIETVKEEAAAKATEARALFDDITARHGISHGAVPQVAALRPTVCWRQEEGSAPALVAHRAKFFDLIVLGRSDRIVKEPHSDTIEEVLLRSGRPVLVAPGEPPAGIGYVVAIGWNGSEQAVRALSAALPWLGKASTVLLLTAGDTAPADGQAAVDYLAWHEISAEQRKITNGSGRHVGRALLEAAREAGADMLVMGGYGHSPWREQLLGGATRTALATTPLPLLLVH